jgi:two-component system chemotaxis response regulator CheB
MYFPSPCSSYDLVALASSAGGFNALTELMSGLPANFPAAIIIVQHLLPTRPTMLPSLLEHRTELHIKQAEEEDLLTPGYVYIAPPDHHLLVNINQTLSLTQTDLVNYVRPSADVLFRTASQCFHERLIGIVLSGSGKDGSLGVRAIHDEGGIVIAQSLASAMYYSMPQAAIHTGCVDYVLAMEEIPIALISLVRTGKLP